jgi:hypothetical protein
MTYVRENRQHDISSARAKPGMLLGVKGLIGLEDLIHAAALVQVGPGIARPL